MEDPGERELQIEVLLSADRFRVEKVRRTLPNGSVHSREVIRHPGAVVIIPVLDDGRLCLIRNYRVAVNREMLELPAGTLEPPEPPLETAYRELLEETGFRAKHMRPLCEFAMSPGILDERMHAFVATGLTLENPAREIGEEIDNVLASIEEVDRWLAENRIQDAKTVAGLLYFLRYAA